MRILSIYPNHDSATCLLEDGEVVLNWELERYSRVRHDYGYSEQFVRTCLDQAGWRIADVNVLCINYDRNLAPRIEGTRAAPPFAIPETTENYIVNFRANFLGHEVEADAINHHLAHAASSFFTSPFETSAILTFDGGGDRRNFSISRGIGNRNEKFVASEVPYLALWWDGMGAGNFGFELTHVMDPGSAAGKIMALAAFGAPDAARTRQLREEIADPKLHQHPVYPELGIYCFDDFADHSDTYARASQSLARTLQNVTNADLADYFNARTRARRGHPQPLLGQRRRAQLRRQRRSFRRFRI